MIKKILSLVALAVSSEIQAQQCQNKEIALNYITSFLGKPYHWGGDDPVQGFDCSGLAIEYLRCRGILNNGDDFTAAKLYTMFVGVEKPKRGDLVFYKNSNDKIIHVEIMLNKELSIGASGGGSKTLTVEDAIKQNAFIKINNIYNRKGIAGFARP